MPIPHSLQGADIAAGGCPSQACDALHEASLAKPLSRINDNPTAASDCDAAENRAPERACPTTI
jgi:hypothetical protein